MWGDTSGCDAWYRGLARIFASPTSITAADPVVTYVTQGIECTRVMHGPS